MDRLEVLSRQLTSAVERSETAADEQRPLPAGGKGTLTVVDNRTGKKYTVREWGCNSKHLLLDRPACVGLWLVATIVPGHCVFAMAV